MTDYRSEEKEVNLATACSYSQESEEDSFNNPFEN